MNVHFRVLAQLKIDHHFQVLDIETTCGDVGRHQDRATLVGKSYQHLVAIPLLQVTMQGQDTKALCLQRICNLLALLFGVTEDHTGRRIVVTQ